VHQPYYRRFALFLAGKGYTVYTFDYRGTGQSRPRCLKGFEATLQQWGKLDLEAVIRYIRTRHAADRLVYIGHSIGGQLPALTGDSKCFSRIILVASQLTHWQLWPLHTRFGYALLLYAVLPVLSRLFGYFPGRALGIFWDLPKGVALELARWGRLREGLFSRYPEASLTGLKVPLLAVSFGDDIMAPSGACKALVARYGQALVTRRHYRAREAGRQKIGHLGFFRKQFSESLWMDTWYWMQQTAPGAVAPAPEQYREEYALPASGVAV
jgi:predicted alpha/beta hydrolase